MDTSPVNRQAFYVGCRVRALIEFSGVPAGTESVVDEDYGSGVMVAWDLPWRPLPLGYRRWEAMPGHQRRPLQRDRFDKQRGLQFLAPVSPADLALVPPPSKRGSPPT